MGGVFMKQILGIICAAVFFLGLVFLGMLICQSDVDCLIGQGRDYLQENLPRFQEMCRETMQQVGRGMKAVFRFLQQQFMQCTHYGLGFPPQLCQWLQTTFGEENTGWWCIVCSLMEKAENIFCG
jgi:uncharacterized protein YsxB (DUF464 family)